MRRSPRKSTAPRKLMKPEQAEDDKQWLFVMPEECVLKNSSPAPQNFTSLFVKLRHPKTDSSSQFMFTPDNTQVCEIMNFCDKPRSWFVGNTVQKDGSLFVTTPVDPLFLILPYLQKRDKFMLLDQAVTDSDFPECSRLLSCVGTKRLSAICDQKKIGEESAFRLNVKSTLAWLTVKVDRLAAAFEKQKVNVSCGARSATFVRSKKDQQPDKTAYRKYACSLVCEYLNGELTVKLLEHLGFDQEVVEEPITPPETEPPAKCLHAKRQLHQKKQKSEAVEPTEDYSVPLRSQTSKKNKPQKMTATQKAISKMDKSGMKSISSFFAKK